MPQSAAQVRVLIPVVRSLRTSGTHTNMNKPLPLLLLLIGLAIIGYGLMKKDDGQAEIDLGKTGITLGKRDSAFNGYFILGGVVAAAGVVLLAVKKKG